MYKVEIEKIGKQIDWYFNRASLARSDIEKRLAEEEITRLRNEIKELRLKNESI